MTNNNSPKTTAPKGKPLSEKIGDKKPKAINEKQVRLRLTYVDFWSITKIAFLGSVALAIVQVIATLMVWVVLNQTGIFATIGDMLEALLGDQINIIAAIGLPQVMLFTFAVAFMNIILGTALGAVVAGLYNLAAKITGGIRLGFTNS